MNNFVTASEASKIIGVTNSRIRQLAIAGLIVGTKFGRSWMFDRDIAIAYRDSRRRGRSGGDKWVSCQING
jgi:hypothetical protein